jgi:hypothetical protein
LLDGGGLERREKVFSIRLDYFNLAISQQFLTDLIVKPNRVITTLKFTALSPDLRY